MRTSDQMIDILMTTSGMPQKRTLASNEAAIAHRIVESALRGFERDGDRAYLTRVHRELGGDETKIETTTDCVIERAVAGSELEDAFRMWEPSNPLDRIGFHNEVKRQVRIALERMLEGGSTPAENAHQDWDLLETLKQARRSCLADRERVEAGDREMLDAMEGRIERIDRQIARVEERNGA
ncbi:hypothetical protein CKO28_18835 [Rhodovibrio sodomensis]|uniref:KfrA N-terminal DNA-binding domain-containing protein n=1 Tax=Rhodovibrio sodomensis TaxID=1088 RepID=A0ABS1DHZ6_9PROT|nr:hypothetical protein [Rhodovibrio sodomensis]MBK1670095.1 hypothetical protein [Rhodovibrio sodomensis]